MASASFQTLVDDITQTQQPLVWSLIVSVFGDLAPTEGSHLSSATLGQINKAIGIKPEATRVALHRLRKDGWLQSERTGRTSFYSLTDHGRAQTVAATPRIYSPQAMESAAWLCVSPTEAVAGGINVAPGIFIAAERPSALNIFAKELSADDTLPDWMTERICPTDLFHQTASVTEIFRRVQQRLPNAPLSAIETAVLRVLIVHTWRRAVLRTPKLPDWVFPAAWTGSECRRLAYQLLTALPAPSPEDLVT